MSREQWAQCRTLLRFGGRDKKPMDFPYMLDDNGEAIPAASGVAQHMQKHFGGIEKGESLTADEIVARFDGSGESSSPASHFPPSSCLPAPFVAGDDALPPTLLPHDDGRTGGVPVSSDDEKGSGRDDWLRA
eukprot:4854388-Pyramimonas_sp.AAC.1